ncbi:UNVERIFIED_CONTAM: hypothetical protein NCL1_20803 [Trichonephila clavipes]
MVWARIRIGGLTYLHISRNGNLMSKRYVDEILRPHVMPYVAAINNVRPHTASLVENFLEAEIKQRMEWLACSSDLNSIWRVWDIL